MSREPRPDWSEDDRLYRTRHEAIADMREYVAVYYNSRRFAFHARVYHTAGLRKRP